MRTWARTNMTASLVRGFRRGNNPQRRPLPPAEPLDPPTLGVIVLVTCTHVLIPSPAPL